MFFVNCDNMEDKKSAHVGLLQHAETFQFDPLGLRISQCL